jgi:hypothetical protein
MLPASDQETRQTTDGNLPDAASSDQFAVEGERQTDGPSARAGTPVAGVTVPVLGISAVFTHGELALSFVQIKTVLSYGDWI